jgi:redox-regulated HSP33 family molecular chaperone
MIRAGVRAGFVVATGTCEAVFAETLTLVAVASILASAIVRARLLRAIITFEFFFA